MTTGLMPGNVQSLIAIIDSLEPGESKTIQDVAWEEYEQLLSELGEGYAVRIAYAEGKLEVMAPLYRHEKIKETVSAIVRVLCEGLGLRVESAGSTTLRPSDHERGAEPDACFYIQHASQVVGKDNLDLALDPPPDLVFEVDVTSKSRSKIVSYAGTGVPEFWRYDGKRFSIHVLFGGKYAESHNSITFPFVLAEDLRRFIELSMAQGQDSALASLRKWLRKKASSS